MTHLSFSEFTQFVQHVTLEVSSVINKYFELNALNTRRKSDGTLVTDADLTAEKYIREQINLHFENHAILGEEFDDDFKDKYGKRGEDFIECHHINPISLGEKKTSLSDLVLLCSNCHRMIHKKQPWLELHELIEIIE